MWQKLLYAGKETVNQIGKVMHLRSKIVLLVKKIKNSYICINYV